MSKSGIIYLNNRYFLPLENQGRVISINTSSRTIYVLFPDDKIDDPKRTELVLNLSALNLNPDFESPDKTVEKPKLKLKTKFKKKHTEKAGSKIDNKKIEYEVNYSEMDVKNFNALKEVVDYLKEKPELKEKPKLPERRIEPRFVNEKELSIYVDNIEAAYSKDVSMNGISFITTSFSNSFLFNKSEPITIEIKNNVPGIIINDTLDARFILSRSYNFLDESKKNMGTIYSGNLYFLNTKFKEIWSEYVLSKFDS